MRKVAWAAGIVEGEGCIIMSEYSQDGRVRRQVRLAVEMTDLDVLERLAEVFGPRTRLRQRKPPSLNPRHRDRYILTLSGVALLEWLQTLYPFFGDRRKRKVREALRMIRMSRNRPYHRPNAPDRRKDVALRIR